MSNKEKTIEFVFSSNESEAPDEQVSRLSAFSDSVKDKFVKTASVSTDQIEREVRKIADSLNSIGLDETEGSLVVSEVTFSLTNTSDGRLQVVGSGIGSALRTGITITLRRK